MPTLFHGWRRKIGALTLLMASLVFAVWVRSHFVEDQIVVHGDRDTDHVLAMVSEGFAWLSYRSVYEHRGARIKQSYKTFKPQTNLRNDWKPSDLNPYDVDIVDFKIDVCGFYLARWHSSISRVQIIIVPFWPLILPLTLFSAHLLRSKPGKKADSKT